MTFDGTPEEWAEAHAACLRAAGFRAVVERSDSVAVPDVRGRQRRVLQRVSAVCRAEIGELPVVEITAEFLEAHYEDQLATKLCLESEGYEIDEPPTLEDFIATYDTDPWAAYTSIARRRNLPDREWFRLEEVCPQPG